MKKSVIKLVAVAGLAFAFNSVIYAQSNLGADCGCPAVASRPTILLSTLATSGGALDGELTASSTVLTCDKTYILDKKIYVPNTKTLTIAPGTVIKGQPKANPIDATALIIERGGKIFASGTASCQIVFTAEADPMNGTYGVSHHGDWGGVVLLGKASNNITLANATAAFGGTCTGSSCFGTGVGTAYIEGFTAADARNQYGGGASPDDNDNSGILRYVSIRHAGAVVVAASGNELNGLTLGSVGRGTSIDHVEVIAANDDGVEIFGGSVNLKHIAVMFGMDDMFDWDQGWSGKAQFLFGLAADSVTTGIADNGFEADGDDNKTNATPRSHPVIYNATLISNGMRNQNVADNSAHAAINAKELTEGEIYNSIFSNFETGLNMQKTLSGGRTIEVYDNWNGGSFKVNCNTFFGNFEPLKVDKSKTSDGVAPTGADLTKFSADNNLTPGTLPGFDFVYAMNTSTNAVTNQYDATPNPNLTTTCSPVVDGFFTPAAYRGAFESNKKSWLSDWAITAILKVGTGQVNCPTDLNNDNVTNNVDFLQLLGEFNQNCD